MTKANAFAKSDQWIRRQTLANAERFITPELRVQEGQIFQLRVRAYQREYELFCQLHDQVGVMAAEIWCSSIARLLVEPAAATESKPPA